MTPKHGRTEGVPDVLIQKRLDSAITLKIKGYSQQEILDELNRRASTENWGVIAKRQLKRMFARYYRGLVLSSASEEREAMKGQREAHLESMERSISIFQRGIEKKTEWKPYEKEKAEKTLFDMMAKYATLRGWDYSVVKKSEDEVLREQQRMSLNDDFDEAERDLANTAPEVVQDFIKSMEPLKKKLKEKRIKDRKTEPHVIIIDEKTGEKIAP